MTARLSSLVLLAALLIVPATAKDKKKVTLPEYVLRASTVRVVVNPDAGEPLDNPMANSTARENVERALMNWGRFQLAPDGGESDLLIAVRTGSGKMMRPTIKGGPIDNRPGEAQTTDDSIRIGGHQGHPPTNDPGLGPQGSPRMGNEVGPSDELFLAPVHPYTEALLSAIPAIEGEEEVRRERIVLEGEVPSPVAPPSGCRFRTRCRYATDICRTERPPLADHGGGRFAACHHPLDAKGAVT